MSHSTDLQSRPVHRTQPEVVDGKIQDPAARERAAVATDRTRRILAASQASRSLRPLGAGALMVLGLWLMVSQWNLMYHYTARSQDTTLRDTGFAIVVFLAGAWSRRSGRSPVASGLAMLCGLGLLLCGLLLPHSAGIGAVFEAGAGVLVLLASAATLSA
jgi:peptidoglycan/LPS O-acetylase OafA/YrhL